MTTFGRNRKRKIIQEVNEGELEVLDKYTTQFIQERQIVIGTKYFVNLDFDIADASYYRKFFDVLQNAVQNDEIILRINNSGGFLDTFIEICFYLLNTQAYTIAEVHNAYSASSLIMLACDEIILNPFSSVMFHSCQSSPEGSIDEVTTNNDNEVKRFRSILENLSGGFLSADEIKNIMNGKTYFWGYNEIKKRLKNRMISKLRKRNEEG